MKNELGIEVCCANCNYVYDRNHPEANICTFAKSCRINGQFLDFDSSVIAYESRIKELIEQQFTGKEASTVLVYMRQANLIIKNENAHIPNIESIFSKLEKMKGLQ